MKVFDIVANEFKEAIILPVNINDFPLIKKSKRFVFNWHIMTDKIVYKLLQKGNEEILGLVCIAEHHEGFDALEIELLEVGKNNVGKRKKN